jgi:hypothetical protein
MKITNTIPAALISIVFIFSACSDDESFGRCGVGLFNNMTFGHFYGECVGEGCVEIYKIESDGLFEDTLDMYPLFNEAYAGQFQKLSNDKFEAVKDLIDEFPTELFGEENVVIGNPDGGDWGGIYLEYNRIGYPVQYWILDKNEENMPAIYNDYVDKIIEKIALINQ